MLLQYMYPYSHMYSLVVRSILPLKFRGMGEMANIHMIMGVQDIAPK